MSVRIFTQGRCAWNNPRPQSGLTREYVHGPLLPLVQPRVSLLERLRRRK